MEKTQVLLPIGTRVTHWGGEIGTHGIGTIIAYNGVEPSRYLENNFKEAVTLASEAGLLNALPSMFYDKTRCPYVVRFDPNPEKVEKYPRGYKDVYETDSVRPISRTGGGGFESVFIGDAQIMGRAWEEKEQVWSPWIPLTQAMYEVHRINPNAEFCIRERIN